MNPAILLLAVGLGLATGCSTLSGLAGDAPVAKITLNKKEAKQKVKAIVIPGTVGGSETSRNIVLAAAVAHYGDQSRPTKVIEKILSQAGAPEGASDFLFAEYAAQFVNNVAKSKKIKGAKRGFRLQSNRFKVPNFKFKVPRSVADLKKIVETFKAKGSEISQMVASVQSGKVKDLLRPNEANTFLMKTAGKINSFIFKKLDTNYVLMTHIHGDQALYRKGKPVKLTAALVNTKTGKFRYFIQSTTKRDKTIPLPYDVAVGRLATSIFDKLEESGT